MKKTVALLLAFLSLMLVCAACGEKEEPKLSDLSDEDMMAYLEENGIESPDDIYGEMFHEAAAELRKIIKTFENDFNTGYKFRTILNVMRYSEPFSENWMDWDKLFKVVLKYHGIDYMDFIYDYYGLDSSNPSTGE